MPSVSLHLPFIFFCTEKAQITPVSLGGSDLPPTQGPKGSGFKALKLLRFQKDTLVVSLPKENQHETTVQRPNHIYNHHLPLLPNASINATLPYFPQLPLSFPASTVLG